MKCLSFYSHIDLLKIIEVKELTAAQQDKNNASFNIVCEGRTFQLQAYDEVEMRRCVSRTENEWRQLLPVLSVAYMEKKIVS